MRIALFTSGGATGAEALRALSARHEIVSVVQPGHRSLKSFLRPIAVWSGLKKKDALGEVIRNLRVQHLFASSRGDPVVLRMLETKRPDIICIAGYRWVLRPELYSILPFGAINVHPSLLPRYRGRAPLFWVYYNDERCTGVTVHQVTEQADAGPILSQQAFDIPRGWAVDEMHNRCAQLGATMLAEVCDQIENQCAVCLPQDESIATVTFTIAPGTRMIDFTAWPAERVWHFLAGLSPHYREPLLDSLHQEVAYRRAVGYRTAVELGVTAGTAVPMSQGWLLQCLDGVVELSAD